MAVNTKLFDGIIIFTQVLNCGSFSAAAIATGHSTSYISKEINKLESRLGVRLLNRTTRSLSLTPEGKIYLQQCQQLIIDADQAQSLIALSDLNPKGVLKISCPIEFGLNYLRPILSEFLLLYPNVKLDLDLNDRKVDVVQDGFDLVIRATAQLEESSLICRKIFSCNGYTVASHDYIAKYGIPTQPEDLKNHLCICYANLKTPTRWTFKKQGAPEHIIDINAHVLCNSSQMELALVLDGQGICRLPEFTMAKALHSQKLVVLFQEYLAPEINVYAVYPSKKHLSPKIRCFIDLLIEKLD